MPVARHIYEALYCKPHLEDAATYVWLVMISCALPTQAALSVFGRQHLDVLVSNAAVNPAGGPILQMEDHVIDKILQVIGAWLLLCCASTASHGLQSPNSL